MRLNRVRNGHGLKRWLMLKLAPLVTGAEAADMIRILWYRPEFFGRPAGPVQQAVLRGHSFWTTGERELFAAYVSAKNTCRFCLDAHTAVAGQLIGQEVVDAVIRGADGAAIRPEARLVLPFLEKLTLNPEQVGPDDVAPLRAAGIGDEAIVDVIYVCVVFSIFNRVADALDCAPLTAKQAQVAAKMLIERGYEV